MSAFRVKIALARAAGTASRLTGRGATSLPGTLLLALDPQAIARLAATLSRGSVAISATNGKTTTAALARSILARAGVATVDNFAGANMAGGVATALLGAGTRAEDSHGALGLFEVDEFWLALVVAQLEPRVIVLANLFRDQLDRYGELETIADRWTEIAATAPSQLVLGADDPLIAHLGSARRPPTDAAGAATADPAVLYFGIEDEAMALPGGLMHASDSTRCRRCGGALRYERVYIGHLGVYDCADCGERRPTPQVSAHAVTLNGARSSRFELRTPDGRGEVQLALPGLYNVYNALAAAALATALGIPLATIVAGLAAAPAMFGRSERVRIGDVELQILLVKNPAGANEVLRMLALEPGEHDLLGVLNDRDADGRDVSWIWDVDFEQFASRVRHVTCAGTRAAELALRLKYAGVAPARIAVEPRLGDALDRASALASAATVYALPTYTAMLELREVLRRRGQAERSWART